MNPGEGFAGRILHVDLTAGKTEIAPLDPHAAEEYLGGLGLTIKMACDRIRPGCRALSPENPIVLGAGPLVGTDLPSTSRVYAVTRLPAAGRIGWCGAGGATFGYLMKNAGYDQIVIEGRSERPVYLYIENDCIDIRDADAFRGKGVEETVRSMRAMYGSPPPGILCIGQGGESLLPYSMAFVDGVSTIGRGGFGAVMGSKNLKAILVKGDRGIRVADRKRYKALSKAMLNRIREYPQLKEWQELGLLKSLPFIPVDVYRKIKKRRFACVSCPIGCKDVVEIPDGRFKGMVKFTSSAVNLFTPVIYGFKDYCESIGLVSRLDDYGLDMFEFFSIMQFAKKLCDRGVIPRSEADPEIEIDSVNSMEAWAGRIVSRKGLGSILADGFSKVFEVFGGAKEWAPPLVKGMQPYVGPRAAVAWDLFGTMELGQVLDPRGPHVGASGSPTYFSRRPLDLFPSHLRRMGAPDDAIERILPGRNTLNVGRLLKHSHTWFTILGSLGICARAQINRFYNASLCAELYEAVTGIPTDLPGLRRRAERAWSLLRKANIREGSGSGDLDSLPGEWFEEGGFKEYLTGAPMKIESAQGMIEDYYDEWGWAPVTGTPNDPELP
jgi:aldehyde:ferredoxin oxidoreductase